MVTAQVVMTATIIAVTALVGAPMNQIAPIRTVMASCRQM